MSLGRHRSKLPTSLSNACPVQVLAGFAAFAGLAVAKTANAVDIQDDRKVRDKGFDLIYEARELELPQSVRDGLSQVRSCLKQPSSNQSWRVLD